MQQTKQQQNVTNKQKREKTFNVNGLIDTEIIKNVNNVNVNNVKYLRK